MSQQTLDLGPDASLEDIAQTIWVFLDRNPGGFEIDDLARSVARTLNDPTIDRGVCHRAFTWLRDNIQEDKGRAFITVMMHGRTIYALAQRSEQVIRYHLRRAKADVTRAKRDEKNALAAAEQYPDDRDIQRLTRIRRRTRADAEDLVVELSSMLNGALA
jgi:hypothetical protein